MSDVSCNGCVACCQHHAVLLTEQDEPNMAAYDYRQVGNSRVLKNKPNGDCIHLGSGGCTIYEKRPLVCRTFDCRKHFKNLSCVDQRRSRQSPIGGAAQERLGTLDAGDLAGLADYRVRTAALSAS